eukprot:COSAG04_NODE_9444_length_863_cov_202.446335_1_plen_91_part_00
MRPPALSLALLLLVLVLLLEAASVDRLATAAPARLCKRSQVLPNWAGRTSTVALAKRPRRQSETGRDTDIIGGPRVGKAKKNRYPDRFCK